MTISVTAFAVNLVLTFVSYRLLIVFGGLPILGLWTTLMSWIFLIRLGDVGMASAALRFIARCDSRTDTRKIRSYLDTSLALNSVLFTLLAIVGMLVFTTFLPQILPASISEQETARKILPLMFAGFVLSNLSGLVLGGLTGLHRGYQAALVTVAGGAIQLVVVVTLVPSLGLSGLAIGQLSQHAIMNLVGWGLVLVALRRDGGSNGGIFPRYFSRATLSELLGFSIKSQFANLLNGLFEPISKILVGQIGGLALLGQFELAYKMVSLPRNAVVSGVQATTPAMTRLLSEDPAAAFELYHQSLRGLMTKGGLVLGLTVLGAPLGSWIILGHVDMQFWLFTALIAAGFAVSTFAAPAYLLGIASGRMGGNIFASSVSLACLFAMAPAMFWIKNSVVCVLAVSICLALGGILIVIVNYPLLEVRSRSTESKRRICDTLLHAIKFKRN